LGIYPTGEFGKIDPLKPGNGEPVLEPNPASDIKGWQRICPRCSQPLEKTSLSVDLFCACGWCWVGKFDYPGFLGFPGWRRRVVVQFEIPRPSLLAFRLWQAVDMKKPTLIVMNKLGAAPIAWKCSLCDQRFMIPEGNMPTQTKAALIDAEFSKHVREKHPREDFSQAAVRIVREATKD
jgi:hypothetical protein